MILPDSFGYGNAQVVLVSDFHLLHCLCYFTLILLFVLLSAGENRFLLLKSVHNYVTI